MNCKQGDMAFFLPTVSYPEHTGKIVRCVQYKPYLGMDAWFIDPPLAVQFPDVPDWVADAALRPIRDAGDDAADESHAWLPPVPTTTKEIA